MAKDAVIVVRVTPRAVRDEVVGWRDAELGLRLRAPPVEGRANEALRRLLAQHFSLRLEDVQLVSGATARVKGVRLVGLAEEEVRRRAGGD